LRGNQNPMQYCSKCKITEGPFIKVSVSGGYQYYNCRPCNTARAKSYRSTEHGKERIYTAVYKSIDKLRHKQDAREVLNKAVKKGLVIRPDSCEHCHVECKPHGHHTDYSQPLKVMWLCRSCHAAEHRRLSTVLFGGVSERVVL